MRIEKEKRRVGIICLDGSSIRGVVHINPGERLLDYINDEREDFIAITNAEFFYAEDIQSFRLATKLLFRKEFVILSKSAIKWVEEMQA